MRRAFVFRTALDSGALRGIKALGQFLDPPGESRDILLLPYENIAQLRICALKEGDSRFDLLELFVRHGCNFRSKRVTEWRAHFSTGGESRSGRFNA
jgi:hypothetical protein